MLSYLKHHKTLSRFMQDKKGNFALVWALGLTATMISVGAGIDMSSSARVSATAQSAADQVALASSVFYSHHERFPENSEEGFVDGKLYRGDDIGFVFPSSVDNRRVRLKASYDEEKGEVHVLVSGQVRTSFMGMFSRKYKTLPFSAESTAKFKETKIKNPASIVLVLDNSGSMLWDDKPADCEWVWNRYRWNWEQDCRSPNGAESRIDGLKDSVEDFMDLLDGYVNDQGASGDRVLRTGLIPYNNTIIGAREVDMKWGILSNGDINSMKAGGGTNSSPPISRAWDWLKDEDDIHEAETGEDNPLKYMIFMTDGQNNGQPYWFQRDGTHYWRGIDCSGSRGNGRGNGRGNSNKNCQYTFRDSSTRPNIEDHNSWEEGEYVSVSDHYSKNTCEAMKAQGVRVFTIGFALEPGTYLTNYPPSWGQDEATISEETTDAAYSLLADCASSADDFVAAEDVDELDDAFSIIGESIVEDVIRLSQ